MHYSKYTASPEALCPCVCVPLCFLLINSFVKIHLRLMGKIFLTQKQNFIFLTILNRYFIIN